MKTLARESGVTEEITPHTLRHSFAAHRLRDGLALSRLRDLLGHANISTTQIYTQVQLESDEVVTPVDHRDPVGATS
jgi:integrase/recombinase XerD